MTNEQILKKAIEKAEANGLVWTQGAFSIYEYPEPIIFNRCFAMAFWGDKMECPNCYWKSEGTRYCNECSTRMKQCWAVCLQVMVLQKDPIKYLEQFL
jgi:hypothetical protein